MIFKNLLSTVLMIAIHQSAFCGELKYFETKIDFWGEKQRSTPKEEEPKAEKNAFPWKTYLDPKNKEFFKEGDYTPPEPFMEIARNPTDDNIKQWFEFMRKKNELAARLQNRMQEYLAKTIAPSLPVSQAVPVSPQLKKAAASVDGSRFRIRMYFDSKCPHCKRMFGVLKKLEQKGFQVEALQVDQGEVSESEKVIPIGKADPSELKKHGIQGVPFVIIADLKRKALLPPIQGFHEFEEIMELLRAASAS